MEAVETPLLPDPNEIMVTTRAFSVPPIYFPPTIEEIELLTLDSGPRHDMGDYVMDDVYTCTLWDHIQQNLYTARQLEKMAREHRRQATIEWERFKTRKFNERMAEVIERERAVVRRFEEEGSAVKEERPPIPLIVRNPTPRILTPPIIVHLPRYKPPPSSGNFQNLIIIVESDSGESLSSNYETAPESRHQPLKKKKGNNNDDDELNKHSVEPEITKFDN